MRRRWCVVYAWPKDSGGGEKFSARMYYSEAMNYIAIFPDAIALEHASLGFRVPRRFLHWYTRPLLVLVLGLAVIAALRCVVLP